MSSKSRLSFAFDREQGDRWVSITVGDHPDAASPLPCLARMIVHHPDFGVIDVREHADTCMVRCYAKVGEWLVELSGGVAPDMQAKFMENNPGKKHMYVPVNMLVGIRTFLLEIAEYMVNEMGLEHNDYLKMCSKLNKKNKSIHDLLGLLHELETK